MSPFIAFRSGANLVQQRDCLSVGACSHFTLRIQARPKEGMTVHRKNPNVEMGLETPNPNLGMGLDS